MIVITPEQAKKFNDGYKMMIYCSIDGLTKYNNGSGFVGTPQKFYDYLELEAYIEFDDFVAMLNEMLDDKLISCKVVNKIGNNKLYSFFTEKPELEDATKIEVA